MLYKNRVLEALQCRGEAFRLEEMSRAASVDQYDRALGTMAGTPYEEVLRRLFQSEHPGAFPTKELSRGLIIEFDREWSNAQDARSWAMTVLAGRTTVGIDGSQLVPSKEYGVPAGLVQVAVFENHHRAGVEYVKDARIQVLTGADLADSTDGRILDDGPFHSESVAQRRFTMELDLTVEYLNALGTQPPALVLIDGSLVVSFASQMRAGSRTAYVRPVVRALAASTHNRIPLAGYIDSSYARDMIHMLDALSENNRPGAGSAFTFDAQLLDRKLRPFDRTCAFVCARGDVLKEYVEPRTQEDYSRQVCFVYMRAGAGRLPSRVEFPVWILKAGLLDAMIDLIRAETLIGVGYPYPLEAADAAAVLTTKDRMGFYRIFQDFAESNGLDAAGTAKMFSKHRRR